MKSNSFGLAVLLLVTRTAVAVPTAGDSTTTESTPGAPQGDSDARKTEEPPPTGAAPAAAPDATLPNASTGNATMGAAPNVRGPDRPIVVAQKEEEKNCEPCEDRDAAEGAGTLIVGPGIFDLSSLNDRMQSNGYEKLSSVMTLLGGEGRAVFRSGFVAGARGAALLAPSRNGPGGVEASFGGGFGMLDFGYALVHTAPFLFTLTGGIGGYGVGIDIGDTQPATFDDVLKNPHRSASLSRGGLLVGLTLGMDVRIHTGPAERGRRGFFTIGLRVGGLYGPPIGDWDLGPGTKATGAPSMSLNGGYAALAIGFGGGRADR